MNEKRFEDDGVEYNNNYNHALLDTYYEFDGKMIIEWNKHSDNVEYTDFERITEILNIKQMRLESLMKHREEIGKLFDRIDELKKDIDIYKYEEKKHSESARKLYDENERLRNQLERKTILLKIRTKHIDDREKSFHELLNYLESFCYKSNIDGNYAKQDIINILNNWEIREYD